MSQSPPHPKHTPHPPKKEMTKENHPCLPHVYTVGKTKRSKQGHTSPPQVFSKYFYFSFKIFHNKYKRGIVQTMFLLWHTKLPCHSCRITFSRKNPSHSQHGNTKEHKLDNPYNAWEYVQLMPPASCRDNTYFLKSNLFL